MIGIATENDNKFHAGTIDPTYDIHGTSKNNDVNNAGNSCVVDYDGAAYDINGVDDTLGAGDNDKFGNTLDSS